MGSSGEVEALLPHRAPFLFVDRIVDRGPDRIATEWRVDPELPAFAGHFPGDPVLPGVLLAEHCFQSAALLVYGQEGGAAHGTPVLTRIRDARYRRIVRPGAVLAAEVRLEGSVANARYFSAVVREDGSTVARLAFTLALAGGEAP